MLRYNKYGGIFFAADGGASGGTGDPNANQGGATLPNAGDSETDPFAGIDLNDLDPDTRKVVESAKTKFASLQKEKADGEALKNQLEQQARSFQSRYDQAQAQLQRLTGTQPQVDPKVEKIAKFEKILTEKGVTPANAKIQAELMHDMLAVGFNQMKDEIGRDLAPFAGQVIQREAEHAWNVATQNDSIGALQIDEVAKKTWEQVQTLVQQGQQVLPETVKNLAAMAYVEHLEKGGQPNSMPQPPKFPTMGRPSYPGAGASPFRPPQVDPNAPKYKLDTATEAALKVAISKWDVKPKAYR